MFNKVNFAYPTRPELQVLASLDLHVPQGSVLAVVGASGSGKSTLASLLLRYYDPQTGSICIDGTDIRTLSPHWLRGNTGVVSQVGVMLVFRGLGFTHEYARAGFPKNT